MYKFPVEFDPKILIDNVLEQICFTLNTVFLSFDDIRFEIYGSFQIEANGEISSYNEIFPVKDDMHLLDLLGNKVINSNIDPDKNSLTIVFENEKIITINSSKEFESLSIYVNKRRLII